MFGRKRLNMKNAARNRQWNIRITNRKERRRARAKTSFVSDLVDMSIKEMNEMAVIADLTGQFRNLLMDQLSRVMEMEEGSKPPKNFRELSKITIGICPGDGIGPIIMEQAERLLRVVLFAHDRLFLVKNGQGDHPIEVRMSLQMTAHSDA